MCNKCTSCKIYVKRNSFAALKTLERQRTVVGMLFNFFAITSELIVPIFFTTVRGKVPSSTMLLRSKVITNLMKFFKLEKSTVNSLS